MEDRFQLSMTKPPIIKDTAFSQLRSRFQQILIPLMHAIRHYSYKKLYISLEVGSKNLPVHQRKHRTKFQRSVSFCFLSYRALYWIDIGLINFFVNGRSVVKWAKLSENV